MLHLRSVASNRAATGAGSTSTATPQARRRHPPALALPPKQQCAQVYEFCDGLDEQASIEKIMYFQEKMMMDAYKVMKIV
ncbi:hypothetical protein Taro_006235 [Colocasia esculenta]|uniref:Uncharacterized protein n=1 Tax=Colocasia esculenta TaxID=4460 RepID=A0A843TWU4_COLES|nr:hypothetical protein [Colocasia esculenta]